MRVPLLTAASAAFAERLGHLVGDLRRQSRAEAGQLDLSMAPVHRGAVRLAVGGMLPLFDEKVWS